MAKPANTIKKRNKGTITSKGSQAKVDNLGARDYGQWTVSTNRINKKTGEVYSKPKYSVYQEYRKNVRGKRKPKEKQKIVYDKKTENFTSINSSSSYVNRHYHYLEKGFDKGLPSKYFWQPKIW